MWFDFPNAAGINRLQSEMERLFGERAGSTLARVPVYPAVNVWEDDDNLYIESEVPGMVPGEDKAPWRPEIEKLKKEMQRLRERMPGKVDEEASPPSAKADEDAQTSATIPLLWSNATPILAQHAGRQHGSPGHREPSRSSRTYSFQYSFGNPYSDYRPPYYGPYQPYYGPNYGQPYYYNFRGQPYYSRRPNYVRPGVQVYIGPFGVEYYR